MSSIEDMFKIINEKGINPQNAHVALKDHFASEIKEKKKNYEDENINSDNMNGASGKYKQLLEEIKEMKAKEEQRMNDLNASLDLYLKAQKVQNYLNMALNEVNQINIDQNITDLNNKISTGQN